MSSLFFQHLIFFLSPLHSYIVTWAGGKCQVFFIFFVVWFLQAAFSCVWVWERGNQQLDGRGKRHTRHPDLIHIYFNLLLPGTFFSVFPSILATFHSLAHFLKIVSLYAGNIFSFFLII